MPPKPPLPLFALPPRFLAPSQCLSRTSIRTIKSTNPPRPDRFNTVSVLSSTTTAALERKANTLPLRPGALATKKGMTAIYDPETGNRIPCTVLQIDRNQVISHKTRDKHGYWAVQIGAGWRHASNITRPELGHYATAGVSPKKWVAEFRVRDGKGLPKIGAEIKASWFKEGQWVDTRSNSKGKGFAGGMKRHGWRGQPASHGTSLTHRAMGSSGGSQGSGSRVHPGKSMPGNMGNERVTVQNLRVLRVDEENGIVVVSGAVAGPNKTMVRIQDAVKKPWPDMPLSADLSAAAATKAPAVEATA